MKVTSVLFASSLIGLSGLAAPGAAHANHVKIEVQSPNVVAPAAPGAVEVQPGAQMAVIYAPAPATVPQLLQADEIKAHEVRAQTIYANRIEADDIRGAVHQSDGVKIGDSRGEIEAPQVAASVIYADEIKANSIVADQIFVRDIDRK